MSAGGVRLSLGLVAALVGSACVEPSQARVTETPEQLLNNNDCASYKPVMGVMPGASTAAQPKPPLLRVGSQEAEAPAPSGNGPCAGSIAPAPPP